MAERYRPSRPTAKRQPLSELRNHQNTPPNAQTSIKRTKTSSSSPAALPHNEFLEPNGSLAVRNGRPSSPEPHKRISQITAEERDSKRNSAASSNSTNTSATRKRKTFIGPWQLGKTIGKGGCSRVRVVRHRYRDQYGAVKIITRSAAESTRAQSLANLIESTKGSTSAMAASGHKPIPYGLVREIAIMKLLEHPNIVQLYDVWENHNELYLIMEYVEGGELFHYVDERRGLPEDEAVYVFRQIVAALLYCHRLQICHRDLKPENILLNQEDLTVKLIDFGMAALQPDGRLLSTPCGSPHYAAPEVISSHPYDGTRADVWSCGVILYVILTGMTPYNYDAKGDVRTLFRDIARAQYYMPPDLSVEAKDLIRRIFVPDPKRRITMDDVWDHPWLHKFDKVFAFDGPEYTKEAAIGPVPELECWRVERIQDIDREILRNMRTLWHSETEQALVQKLLNGEHNQEKIFYAALLKHREENQENYCADEMGYSASDHHHSQPASTRDAPPLPLATGNAARSQSQYSIMNNEHLKSSQIPSVRAAPSVASYDPYRASRSPMIDGPNDYNVTIHRHGSNNTNSAGLTRSLRHPNPLRIETLKQQNRRLNNRSSSSLSHSAGRSRRSAIRSSNSYSSMRSQQWPSSPPIIASMRPSDKYKRGVNFGHVRRTSTASWLTTQASLRHARTSSPGLPSNAGETRPKSTISQAETPSPAGQLPQQVASRKEKDKVHDSETTQIKVRPPSGVPNYSMRNDIRKHSAELEKACEEAFFRSSIGSNLTARTSLTDKPTPYDTPPSSIKPAQRDSTGPPSLTRPLPDPPKDTPNTYLTRTLEETREKLAAFRANPDDNTTKFDEVMKMLENIMPQPADRRSSSVPNPKPSDNLGALPVISEESDPRVNKEVVGNWQRSATAPIRQERVPTDQTVRMVSLSSPGVTPAPLVIKKRSSGSQLSSKSRLGRKASPEVPPHGLNNQMPLQSHPIDASDLETPPPGLRKKRSGWLGLGRKEPEPREPIPGIPTAWLQLDERLGPDPKGRKARYASKKSPSSETSSEFPIRKKPEGHKSAFTKWLGRKSGKNADKKPRGYSEIGLSHAADDRHVLTDETDMTIPMNPSLDSFFSATGSPSPSSADLPHTTGVERSWFARFFHLKPAVQILCFAQPRARVLSELVLLFQAWQRHGIRDLAHDRRTHVITARVGRRNTLDIRPVSFRVELFVVLEHGRKARLSIARFVQVKGAASGFRRVVEVVEGVMRGRRWLVEDEEKCRALCEIMGT